MTISTTSRLCRTAAPVTISTRHGLQSATSIHWRKLLQALALSIMLVALCGAPLSAMQTDFTLKTDSDTITIIKGKPCSFNINMTVPTDFDGWITLRSASALSEYLSDTVVHSPYTGVKLTIYGTLQMAPGVYDITLSGEYFPHSGDNSATTHCYVRILPLPYNPDQWRIFQTGFLPTFVLQDSEKNYWFNYASVDTPGSTIYKQGASNLIEKIKEPRDNFHFYAGRMTNPPVIDNAHKVLWTTTRYFNSVLGGVSRSSFDGKNKTEFTYKNSPLPDSSATAVAIDSKGGAWIGTNKGVAYLLNNEWTIFTLKNTDSVLGKEPITSITVSEQNVWIGTTNGLVKFDGTAWTRFTPQNSGMPAPFVWNLAAEQGGGLWMGLSTWQHNPYYPTYGRPTTMIGVAKFDGKNWTLYNHQNTPLGKDNYVNSISIDSKGTKWFSTASASLSDSPTNFVRGAGIVKFDNTTWTAFTTANSPLITDNVNWVGLDNDDNVWFTSYFTLGRDMFWGVYNEQALPPFLFSPVGVEELPNTPADGITISPNPINSRFTITGAENVTAIHLLNSMGMEVAESRRYVTASGTFEMDVSDVAAGVYGVVISTPTGIITKMIVVSR